MHVALDALAYVPAAQLTVIGDGPDRVRLEQHAREAGLNGRVRFVGSLPRDEVLDALAGAEATVLSSDWENFPHAAVESLAVGTPLVATAVGGVGEIVVDGVNGLLVPPGSPEAFGHALERLLGSPELLARLSDGARASVAELDAERIYGRIEELLAAGGSAVTGAVADGERPRILMVGRLRYSLPLPDWLARKFDALERQLDLRVVASADPSSPATDDRFRLLAPSRVGLLDGGLFYLRLPFHVRRQIVDFRPEAIIAENPYTAAAALVGRALARGRRPQVVLEVHGDWRTATRLYGAPSRRFLSPLADAVGRTALRRADAVRALSGYTEGLVEEVRGTPATASFEAYMDLSTFTATPPVPLPERPTALFVGVLEAYKNIDGLADAWRRVAREVPEARLVILGEGSRRDVVDEPGRGLARAGRAHRAAPAVRRVGADGSLDRARAALPLGGPRAGC